MIGRAVFERVDALLHETLASGDLRRRANFVLRADHG
jgi:hypothetical protein